MQDSIPPITLEQMTGILKNPNFKTYLVVGNQSDRAWKLALAAQNFLPGVRSYRVQLGSQKEVREHFGVPSRHVGIVFGRSRKVVTTLTVKQATDFLTVVESITAA